MARSFAIPITLLALLGSVAFQNVYAPSTSPAAVPPSPSPSSPNVISSPPSQSPPGSNPPTYPPSSSPPTIPQPSASSPMAYPPSSSPLMSSTPPINPPKPSPPTNPPSTSPLGSPPPTYPPNPSPPIYPPSPSPSSSVPPSYPPSASPPVYPSPNPSPSVQSPSTNPTPSPSPSPTSSVSSPPNYPPSVSPSPSPTSSISSPPNYPPSASPGPSPAPSGLSVGYYRYSCPNAESIVRDAVKSATDSNPGTGAGLIRLFFHDCFVQGCDASVLLNTTGSTQPTERASAPNLSLRGFEVIDAAKAALEAACPGVVSCADIVAFAGRDATFFLGGGAAVDFDMPAGRYDGRVSLDSEALANLPPPFAGLQDLKDMFAAKGLDADDMVTLSGAHTVGRAHCSSFSDRLPPNTSDMNATLAARLAPQCNGSGGDPAVPQDLETPEAMDSQYYRNVINHEVLFASDAALLASNQTAAMVSANAFTPGLWETKFKAAMVKMGRAGVKTSADGEIRKKCWMVNQ